MSTQAETVRAYIVTTLIHDEGFDLAFDEPIFSSGLLGSFSVLQLMQFLEDRFRIRVPVAKLTLDNFDSVNKIVDLVQSQMP